MATQPVSHQMDVYGAWLHVATTKAQWAELKKTTGLKMGKVTSIGLTQRHVHRKTGALAFAIYLDVATQTEHELLEVVAHEATHVAGLLLDHVGQKYDGGSEALAYLVGWLTAFLWDSCK